MEYIVAIYFHSNLSMFKSIILHVGLILNKKHIMKLCVCVGVFMPPSHVYIWVYVCIRDSFDK